MIAFLMAQRDNFLEANMPLNSWVAIAECLLVSPPTKLTGIFKIPFGLLINDVIFPTHIYTLMRALKFMIFSVVIVLWVSKSFDTFCI